MNISLLLAFWGVVALLIAVPGPDWAYVLAAGLRDRSPFPAVAGIVLGYVGLTAAVAAGVGALVAHTPVLLTAITIAGAAYLVYLGVSVLRRPAGVHGAAGQASASPPPLRRVVRGVGVSGLNPKGLLVFVAILPQFTDAAAGWPIAAQLAALGLVFAATCAAFYSGLGAVAHAVLGLRPVVVTIISRVSGVAMVIVGVTMVAERVAQIG